MSSSSSSICSGYRYQNQKPFLMFQKPLQFTWFSTALKNIKETNDDGSKDEKEMEVNRTVATVSSSSSTDNSKCPGSVMELKLNNEQSELVRNGNELKLNERDLLTDQNVSLMSKSCNNKANLEIHRKSLTAMYLEKQNLEKEADMMDESQEGSWKNEFSNVRNTKDEGPVRQSLLSLVMDEDVPELMEAMAEKLEFVFEDLTPSVSTASEGILRNSAKRTRSRSRPREAKLGFHSSSPTVFTYPNEESAVEKAQWDEGEQITFTVYRELCQGKKEHSMEETNKFHQSFVKPSQITASNTELSFIRTATLMEEPSMAESLLGVTGRISYNSTPIDLARFNKNTAVSLIAGK
ncbi:Uncharacterized protein BM_BM8122 [Brugia malayi]|uniref:Bm8122 n=2 Tax=Brugia TaxID=6278 RepID=A0A0K0JUU6_BRUMA|nr:Uncharacterized protein BM_BM8122 [Brugia malayi]CRZ22074.1 Bm8122 [Brugia malayi]VIO89645.1 Uncharacterized protein BM_BM8122 [Brugia malayi]